MKPKLNNQGGPLDECYTPIYATFPLVAQLRPGATIWEPACGSGRLARALAAHGFTVITSSLQDGGDFLSSQPDEPYDYIITNPPYHFPTKLAFVQRALRLGVPWAFLVQVETLGTGGIMRLFQHRPDDFEELFFTSRIHFEMPKKGDPLVHLSGDPLDGWEWGDKVGKWVKHQAQFPVFWLCHHVLPQPRIISDVHYCCELPGADLPGVVRTASMRQDNRQLVFDFGGLTKAA